MSNIDKQTLREAAEKATKGEWWSDVVETDGEYGEGEDRVSGYHSYAVYVGHESLLDMTNSTAACIHTEWDHDYHMAWDETAKRNAEFIAAANPATVLALLDELDSLESFRTAFMVYSDKTDWVQTDKRFDVIKPWGKHRADVLREFIEHLESKLVAAESGFPPLTVERLIREKGALEKRVAELEAREVRLPQRFEVEMCPTPSPDGDWYSREDVLAALATAGVRIYEEG